MSRSKRSLEGVFVADHSDGPGLPDELMPKDMPLRSGRQMFEAPTYTCSHCPRVVVMNPARRRPRGYCRKCDHYICDVCNGILHATGVCKPYKQVLDELQEQGAKLTDDEGEASTIIC